MSTNTTRASSSLFLWGTVGALVAISVCAGGIFIALCCCMISTRKRLDLDTSSNKSALGVYKSKENPPEISPARTPMGEVEAEVESIKTIPSVGELHKPDMVENPVKVYFKRDSSGQSAPHMELTEKQMFGAKGRRLLANQKAKETVLDKTKSTGDLAKDLRVLLSDSPNKRASAEVFSRTKESASMEDVIRRSLTKIPTMGSNEQEQTKRKGPLIQGK